MLEIPLRRLVHSPRQLAAALELAPDARVLELGPGPGFYSVEIARRVPRGRLQLFDLQREMLAKARAKLARAGLSNVGFAQGDGAALPYADGAFDAVFLVAVLGEVPDPSGCVCEVARVLAAGGLASFTELPGDPDFTPLEELKRLCSAASLEFERSIGGARRFTANFRKRARVRAGSGADPALRVEDRPDPRDIVRLEDRINEFNFARTGFHDGRELAILERDAGGDLVAGLYGWTWGASCEVRFLWVRQDHRKRGLGTRLLQAAEAEAARRGAGQIVLSTHGFQAPHFYRRLGYEVTGVVDDHPRGWRQYWMRKALTTQ
jgi:SAM-dependent methyltransferase